MGIALQVPTPKFTSVTCCVDQALRANLRKLALTAMLAMAASVMLLTLDDDSFPEVTSSFTSLSKVWRAEQASTPSLSLLSNSRTGSRPFHHDKRRTSRLAMIACAWRLLQSEVFLSIKRNVGSGVCGKSAEKRSAEVDRRRG